MRQDRFDVALFGSVFVDHILTGIGSWPQPGEEVQASHYQREAGGGCFNTACGLAKLGDTATCFAMVGQSEDGCWLLNRIRSFGVSTEFARFSSLPTAVTVAVSHSEERSFFTFDGANAELAAWLEWPELLTQLSTARHVHFAYPLPVNRGLKLLRALREAGCTVSLDAGWTEEWLRNPDAWLLLKELDWFFPNQKEAVALTGECGSEDILRVFRERGVNGAVLKLGAGGAAMLAPELITAPAIPVQAADTTGAGDAFNAGFLHAFLGGLPAERCLKWGAIHGSLSVRKIGSLEALPSRDEVLEYL